MLKRHLSIALRALLAVAIATGVSAAEDNPDTKRCGGYYACIELRPAQPDSLSQVTMTARANSSHPALTDHSMSEDGRLRALAAYLAACGDTCGGA